LVGGLDISFIVGDEVNACACYVVLDSDCNIVYKQVKMVQICSPYIPGYLAFREFKFLAELVEEQILTQPELTPEVLMVDGNGILHPNRAGIASHLGVELGIPSIGVAKNLHMLQELGEIDRKKIGEKLDSKGSTYCLKTVDNEILGCAVKTTDSGVNPVFVSIGTGISLNTALQITLHFSKYRIPEPTRQADVISREYLRLHHPTQRQLQPAKVKGQRQVKPARVQRQLQPAKGSTQNEPRTELQT
jgi:deoxyinosine 3'endonuclease (endonuclease V)